MIFNFLKRNKTYKRIIKKLYENSHQFRDTSKWHLKYQGYSVEIYDMSYWGENEKIKIVEGRNYDGRDYNYTLQDNRELTVQYILNDFQHLPLKILDRMREIFKKDLHVSDDDVDVLTETVEEFFGPEEL